ncbi:MFS transporter [Duganella radicis]|uniref:MFS transporter n=1 Tax=Duganella radicis TaxID=551988 RepID=A0A6L6PFK6_9BURK|nr:MFS transporter [Duganella radicis]MTV37489.1 MFS transporter [Duganella radicis]
MKNMPWRDFAALVASIGVVGLGLGATIPLTALSLDQRGVGSGVIGVITAISAFGILGAAPFVSRWVAGHGPRGCMIGAIVAAALSTALMETTDSLWAWGALRFAFGAAMGVLFTIGEAWVNNLAPENSRGRVVAIYTTAFTLFQMIGPALVAAFAGKVALPFAACGALFLLALPGMLLISGGLSATVVLVGDTALQFAFGWLADHVGRRKVHIGCGVAVCVLLPILPFAAGTPWLWWTLLLVLGAVAGAIYMLSLVACGERFEGQSLVAASAVVNASWGITSAGGPLVTGVLMQTAGVNALPAVLWAGAAIFIASAAWDRD